jgi:hypothetical protein
MNTRRTGQERATAITSKGQVMPTNDDRETRDTGDDQDERATDDERHTREGGGGTQVAADDPRDTSVTTEEAATEHKPATPPTEGPAAAGALPG